MAYVTFGVKVPEELKNELTKLMLESGLERADFMALLRDLYKQSLVNQGQAVVETAAVAAPRDPTEVATLMDEVKELVDDLNSRKRLTEEVQWLTAELERLECLKDVQYGRIEELTKEVRAKNKRLRDRIDQIYQLEQRLTES